MTDAERGGFFEQRTASPTCLTLVVALHAAGIAALLLAKGPIYIDPPRSPTTVYNLPVIPPPPEIKPEPRPEPQPRAVPQHRSRIDTVPPVVNLPAPGPQVLFGPPPIPGLELTPPGGADLPVPKADPAPVAEPVRVEARPDPRFAGDLQAPYPASEERAGKEGSVRIRITIGANGRVKAAERVSATSDAFWRATQRQALSRWRFRPATVDGRPVESVKVMTVHFRLTDR